METSPVITGHLSPELAQIFLQGLPQIIRNGLEMRAKTINYPVWAVIEMARCLRHATRMQAISMKRLYPLSIASPSSTSDARFGFCDRLCVIYDRGVRSHLPPKLTSQTLRDLLALLKTSDRPLPKQKKPGFSDNLCLLTDILCKNPVKEPGIE